MKRFKVWDKDFYDNEGAFWPNSDEYHGEFEAENENDLVEKIKGAGFDPDACCWEEAQQED